MKKVKFLAAFSLMMAIALGSYAQTETRTPQKKRIKQGVRSGELTRQETKTLVKDKKELWQDVREANADGTVTPDEKAELKKERKKVSRKIYRKKHNARDRN